MIVRAPAFFPKRLAIVAKAEPRFASGTLSSDLAGKPWPNSQAPASAASVGAPGAGDPPVVITTEAHCTHRRQRERLLAANEQLACHL